MRKGKGAAVAVAALAVLLAGCGVRPTGVVDGGESAGGLTKGLRLYFVSQTGRLEAVARSDVPLERFAEPVTVLKLLGQGPTRAEREAGLTTLVGADQYGGGYGVTLRAGKITVDVPLTHLDDIAVEDRNMVGQLVCSMARARAILDTSGTKRTDDVPITVRPQEGDRATYVCSDFRD
ncbi:hypothetical protein ACH4E8_13440 [Streptomyces sp. NPDC017979]|uniref:hypothetical protein n=1 Tax=Streptomyces sp. NPDC017979 TaxID=3365024 RepID=UPI003792F7D1